MNKLFWLRLIVWSILGTLNVVLWYLFIKINITAIRGVIQ